MLHATREEAQLATALENVSNVEFWTHASNSRLPVASTVGPHAATILDQHTNMSPIYW
jgi:hypothetical protein